MFSKNKKNGHGLLIKNGDKFEGNNYLILNLFLGNFVNN